MAVYCISDLHGCYDEFMELLELIKFNTNVDTLYVLGDAIDRGARPIDCLQYIRRTKGIFYLLGNHDVMMLDFYAQNPRPSYHSWYRNGCRETIRQLDGMTATERDSLFNYLKTRPYYKTINVGGQKFFMSHAGLDVTQPFKNQDTNSLVWSRSEFYEDAGKRGYTVIFGHTPTFYIRSNKNCSVFYDDTHNDKICIDCGCVYGGALAALRLDDLTAFHVRSAMGGYELPYGVVYNLRDIYAI